MKSNNQIIHRHNVIIVRSYATDLFRSSIANGDGTSHMRLQNISHMFVQPIAIAVDTCELMW